MNAGMKKRSGFKVMSRLIGLVKPFGWLYASLPFLWGLWAISAPPLSPSSAAMRCWRLCGSIPPSPSPSIFVCVVVFAIVRGLLRYAEQASNHFIAFKLLALIGTRCSGRCAGSVPPSWRAGTRGDLIAVITSDIELLGGVLRSHHFPCGHCLFIHDHHVPVYRLLPLAAGPHRAGSISRGWNRDPFGCLQVQRGRWDAVPLQVG